MVWKGLGVLGAAAGLVLLGVVGLAKVTVPDVPTFEEGFQEAEGGEGGSLDFVPTAIGGQIEVTGDRAGTLELAEDFRGSNGKVFFETGPLSIAQMYFEDLAFFPEPDECDFTEGQYNEDVGLIAVRITCPELVDIRDNGAISVDGYAALPADMVRVLDLPETGGTVTVGDVTFEPEDPTLVIGPTFQGGGGDQVIGFSLFTPDLVPGAVDIANVYFVYDEKADTLTLDQLSLRAGIAEIQPGECESQEEELAVVNPQSSIWELVFSCDSIDMSSEGTISVEGHVVYQKIYIAEP